MSELKPIFIEAMDIQDAWFQCISSVIDNGFKYEIQHGSYVGQTRLEFPFLTMNIKKPYSEPYDSMLPEIPAHLNIPNPVARGYIEQYLPYLMTDHIEPGEQYTYGSRMTAGNCIGNKINLTPFASCPDEFDFFWDKGTINQIEHWVKVLKQTPATNQAILQIAQPSDCLLEDPPCLRSIKLKIINDKLIFYPYFRSWDIWGGMPANLAGLAVFQKSIADEIGVESGSMIAFSDGAHIYGYVEELVKLRCGKSKIKCEENNN